MANIVFSAASLRAIVSVSENVSFLRWVLILSDIFTGSRIEIGRANSHISDLIIEIEQFRQSNPYEIVLQENPRGLGR